jgi:hypothetical protein
MVTAPTCPAAVAVLDRCSFCGAGKDEVRRLIVGPQVAICDGCVGYCHDILQAELATDGTAAARAPGLADDPDAAAPAAAPVAADPVMARIAAAQQQALAGDTAGARAAFDGLWDELGPDGDPLHVVSLAHSMADLQDDPADELTWDQRALRAAGGLTDERARSYHAGLSAGGMLPSLHLNLAADYARLGRLDEAREHLRTARDGVAGLPEGGYGQMIRAGIDRLAGEIDS